MSYFNRPPDALEEHPAQPPEYFPVGAPQSTRPTRSPARSRATTTPTPRPSGGDQGGRVPRTDHPRAEQFDRGYVQRPGLEAGAG